MTIHTQTVSTPHAGAAMAKILDEIRKAIRQSKTSRYAISKATGIPESQLSRLMAGTSGLSLDSLERIADFLGLEIVIRPKRRRKGK